MVKIYLFPFVVCCRLWHVSQQAALGCFKHTEFVTGIAFHPRVSVFVSVKLKLHARVDSVSNVSWLVFSTISREQRCCNSSLG